MKNLSVGVSLLLALAASVFAQPTPPPQPASGPGGNNYPYGVAQGGPYVVTGMKAKDTAYSYFIFSPVGLAPGPSNPKPLPTPASAPVILFVHDDASADGNDTTTPYFLWLCHMAEMGYTVIWPDYETKQKATDFATIILADFQDSLTRLLNPGYVAPKLDSKGNVLYSIVGHQAGGYLAYGLGTLAPMAGLPNPKAILSVEPTQGSFPTLPTYSTATISPSTLVITVVGDQEQSGGTCDAVTAWSQMTLTPAIYKPFLLFRSDSHGTPAQLGNIVFPLTNTTKDTDPPPNAVDDRDYNITYKLSVAASACTMGSANLPTGSYCSYALGNGPPNSYGATTQTDMGLWSDATPVLPLVLLVDPSTYFGSQCK